eukprot:CAMPEP_0167825574 /NCGR_PEP_ID=MMETSP0112_2-20121227/9456_1 /TAXON_ID=91324 /ORGANISM="Lotharella globosa, Strain CCCM811" /LENGTH=201 /DNA_ID=CAMNT_0007727725 /DNA_START=46 /DNA_END=647 /DNA_ORIENTATION=+
MPGEATIELKLQTLEDKELAIHAEEAKTIAALKKRISSELKIGDCGKLVLVYDGTVLEDNMTIKECNVDPFSAKRIIVFNAKEEEFVKKAPFLARTWDMESKAAQQQSAGGAGGAGAGGRGVPRMPGLPPGVDPSALAQNPMVQQMLMVAMQQPNFAANMRRAMLAQAEQLGDANLKAEVEGMSDDDLKAKVLTQLMAQAG